MRRFLICIVLCALCTKIHATTPFPPKVFESDGWTHVVGFAFPDENDKVLVIRQRRKMTQLSLKELGFSPMEAEMTTAGSMWYQNSIGHVCYVKLKGVELDAARRVFYFRSRKGKESIVDLSSGKLIEPGTIQDKDDLDKRTVSKAELLLNSDEPRDRQTAVIHLGHLGSSKHLPKLKKLLEDKALYTELSGDKSRTVYYVREAATEAIRLIKSRDTAKKTVDSDRK